VGASGSDSPASPLHGVLPRHVKRLGFGGLVLEPEYLLDRLRHECGEMKLPYQAQEVHVNGAEVMRMEVSCAQPAALSAAGGGAVDAGGDASAAATIGSDRGGLRALVHVLPEDQEGTYSISLMRLVGDTFEFHALYRALRDRLTDISLSGNGIGNAGHGHGKSNGNGNGNGVHHHHQSGGGLPRA